MHNEKTVRFITTKITEQEYEFLEFCRRLGYGELTVIIAEGQQQKAIKCMKSVRFDLSKHREYPIDIPTEDD